jgi:uncharacterized damage-inducible protein DinB
MSQIAGADLFERYLPPAIATVAPAVIRGRAALEAAARDMLAVRDEDLERGWQWRDDEADVRYGLYRSIEAIEAAAAAIAAADASRSATSPRPMAERIIAPATVARWELHGRIAGLDDDWLDRHPKAGEWTLRETLAHIVASQRGYAAFTSWWVARPPDDPAPTRVPEAFIAEAALPEEDVEGAGSLAEIRARFDEILDLSAAHFAALSDAQLARPARWAGIPVDVAFRQGRWSSHAIEHTVQVDKTLAWLDHRPTEAARIVGRAYGAWGRLEALVFPRPPAALDVVDGGASPAMIIEALAKELEADARSARAAATA